MESLGAGSVHSTGRLLSCNSLRAAARGRGGAGHAILDSKLVSSRRWNSLEQACGISVQPTKGALALQGVRLATSHRLERFASDDPAAFAERAAKYSSFGNGTLYESQISQLLPFMSSDSGESRARVGSVSIVLPESEGKTIASSCLPSRVKRNVAACGSHKVETVNNSLQDMRQEAERDAQDPKVEPATGEYKEVKEPRASAGLEDVEPGRIVDGATVHDMDDHVSKYQETREDFSCTEHAARRESSDDTGKKRKEIHSNGKETNTAYLLTDSKVLDENCDEDSRGKRYKGESKASSLERLDTVKTTSFKAAERSSRENSEDSSPRDNLTLMSKENVQGPSEAASKQDYVHVRARRGQATDSHSLAERVRREKISERMNYLQDLVPGCSKVTGKAVMLDEIINYVQALQRHVEMLQSGASSVVGPELPSSTPFNGLHLPLTPPHIVNGLEFQSLETMDSHLQRRTISSSTRIPFAPNLNTFGDDATQMSVGWDHGELQSMLQMRFGQASGATSSLLLEGFKNCQ